MSKLQIVAKIQHNYRRGLTSWDDAVNDLKDLFSGVLYDGTPCTITDNYAEWLLCEYHYN